MKVFLSSTYEDLTLYRNSAAQAIERLGQHGVRMEVFGARPLEATAACLDEIKASDALVGIYAHRYGHVPKGTIRSITEEEFVFAQEMAIPTFCFVQDENYPWPPKFVEGDPGRTRLRQFVTLLREKVVADTFTTPEDLSFKVASSLSRFLLARKIKNELENVPSHDSVSTASGRSQVSRRAAKLDKVIIGARVLLVNDIPTEMSHVIVILRALQVSVDVATSTEAAIELLTNTSYDAIISDMSRAGVEDEGIRFLTRIRERGIAFPVIFTVGRFNPARGTPPFAFGITNKVDELLNLLFDAFERRRG